LTTTGKDLPLVLFADDHADSRDMYAGYFSKHGFRVAEARDGIEAVAVAKRLCPTVVVLDLMMPRMDGIAAIKRLRRHRTLRAIPILVLTAFDDHQQAALAAGATDVCAKPCMPDVLLIKVRELLKASREH
jgi:CheY-like chemotaxis protein